MLELNKLYNMDCMQGMKEFPDGFFDLAIVDPPYGIGIDGQKKRVCGNPKHNRKDHGRSVLFHEVLQRAKEAGGRRLHRCKSGASSGGGLHVGSLYAYVRRYACRVRRSLFSSGLEREQRREI